MLPDFPEPKSKLHERFIKRFEQTRRAELHFFDEMPKIALQEGERLMLVKEDGAEQELSFEPIRVEFGIPGADLPTLTPEALVAKIDQAARDMAKQQHDRIFSELTRAVQAVGNEFDTKGQPLRPEHILEILERIHVDFDQTGKARLPTMVIHPNAEPKFKDVFQRLEEDPALRKRFAEVIALKREEWRARESRRKLVG